MEVAHGFFHLWIMECTALVNQEFVTSLGNAESQGLLTEAQVLGGNVTVKEDVDTFTDRWRQGYHTVDGRSTVKNANEVGKIVQDRQIVLNNDNIVIRSEQLSNSTRSSKSLLESFSQMAAKNLFTREVGLPDEYRDKNSARQTCIYFTSDISHCSHIFRKMLLIIREKHVQGSRYSHIRLLHANQSQSKPLKFSTRKQVNVAILDLL